MPRWMTRSGQDSQSAARWAQLAATGRAPNRRMRAPADLAAARASVFNPPMQEKHPIADIIGHQTGESTAEVAKSAKGEGA